MMAHFLYRQLASYIKRLETCPGEPEMGGVTLGRGLRVEKSGVSGTQEVKGD
jgi:hypothetical protein